MRMDLQGSRGSSSPPGGGPPKRPTSSPQAAPPFAKAHDEAALRYLFRETSLESIRRCLATVRDQELSLFLQESVLRTASLMSSEAFNGLERVRRDLKALGARVAQDVESARRLYDQYAEILSQLVFALGRRLDQLEAFLSGCPFSGSAEQIRGLYGQRVRDLAGDVRFLRRELRRWTDRFVPLRGELPDGAEGQSFLVGRIDAVVDDLGLRLKEIQEILKGAVFDQLVLFDETLTRGKLFTRDLENVLDLDHLMSWLSELLVRVRDYDGARRPEQLERVKSLLRDFQPGQFPALSGVRESDHVLFIRLLPQIVEYAHRTGERGDDPMHVFLLLLGDMARSLRHAGAEAALFDPDF